MTTKSKKYIGRLKFNKKYTHEQDSLTLYVILKFSKNMDAGRSSLSMGKRPRWNGSGAVPRSRIKRGPANYGTTAPPLTNLITMV